MASCMTHTEHKNDVLDEYPLAPLGVCCPALLMSLSVLDLEVSISFYTDKNLLQNLSLSTLALSPLGKRSFSLIVFPWLQSWPGYEWTWPILLLWLVSRSFRPIIYTLPYTVHGYVAWSYAKFLFHCGGSVPVQLHYTLKTNCSLIEPFHFISIDMLQFNVQIWTIYTENVSKHIFTNKLKAWLSSN